VEIGLELGEIRVRLHERRNRSCLNWPLWTFEPFQAAVGDQVDIDLEVRVTRRLPDIPHGRHVFDAGHGLWTLFETEAGGCYLETLDTRTRRPYIRAVLDGALARGEIWAREFRDCRRGLRGWAPPTIINPVVELCLLTWLARHGGVLLHGAGVVWDGVGLIFTGPSEAGKSTLSEFYLARGAPVLSDERIIIRRIGDTFRLCGTPWPGTAGAVSRQVAPLERIYFIRHGSQGHRARRLAPSESARRFLQQCFLPHWDREAMARTLTFLEALQERVECYELAFMKDPDVVDFLGSASVPAEER